MMDCFSQRVSRLYDAHILQRQQEGEGVDEVGLWPEIFGRHLAVLVEDQYLIPPRQSVSDVIGKFPDGVFTGVGRQPDATLNIRWQSLINELIRLCPEA